MDDRKKAMKRLKLSNEMEVEGVEKAARPARSQNLRAPSASTPAATRGKNNKIKGISFARPSYCLIGN